MSNVSTRTVPISPAGTTYMIAKRRTELHHAQPNSLFVDAPTVQFASEGHHVRGTV
jgi:hypothetical protein